MLFPFFLPFKKKFLNKQLQGKLSNSEITDLVFCFVLFFLVCFLSFVLTYKAQLLGFCFQSIIFTALLNDK